MVGEAGETEDSLKEAGAIQADLKLPDKIKKTMIGDIKKTEIMSGS